MSREQREYLLRKQMRAIQEELGDKNPEQADVEELRRQMNSSSCPRSSQEAERELKRSRTAPGRVTRLSSHAQLSRIDRRSSLEKADRGQYRSTAGTGNPRPRPLWTRKVKDRIIEYLAVMKLNPLQPRAPILCFVGPPGVGKTSLGKSIAETIGRRVRAGKPGRRLRRSRVAWPSTNLHRSHARTHYSGHAPRRNSATR